MIGAGTFINPLIKVLTTVAILAAVYFFFVKPALDTTSDITENVGNSISDSRKAFNRELRQTDVPTSTSSYSFTSSNQKAIDKATKCIANAGNDQAQIQECVDEVTK
jgi:hypothetical protein